MSVPGRLLPLHVLLTGRRPCCGVRFAASHLDSCSRRPWSRRADGLLHEPSAGTPGAAADRIEDRCVSSCSETLAAHLRQASHSG